MRGHGAKLPRKRQQAIAALIEFPTVREAAKSAGISESSLLRWLKDKNFQKAYLAAKRRVVDQTITRLQQASGGAVETLQTIMIDRQAASSVRVAASKIILDLAIKSVVFESIEDRLTEIERILSELRI